MGLLIRVAGGPADSHLGLWAYLSVLPLARGSAGSQLGIWAYLSVLPKVLLIAIWAYGPTVPVRVARGPAGSQLPQSLLQFPVTEIDGLTKQSKTSSILLLENLLKISKP